LNHTIKNLAFGVGGTLLFLAFVIRGWGDWRTFFSDPARTGVIILALAGAIAYAFSGSSGLEIGRREDRSSRWIFVPLIIIAVAFACLPPRFDRLNRWTIDGDTVRYLGLIITAIGGFVRVATVFELAIASASSSRCNPITDLRPTAFTVLSGTPAISGRSSRWRAGRSCFEASSVCF
jgi:hypothetical protein